MEHAFVRAVAATTLVVGAAACGLVEPEPSWGDRLMELDRQREVWADAEIASYRYRVMRGCFCSGPVGTFRVTVTDGQVTAAESVHDGEPVPDHVLPEIPTVDSLFAVIEKEIAREVDGYDVEYHSELGYPTLIDIDRDENAIDDEVIYEAGELNPL